MKNDASRHSCVQESAGLRTPTEIANLLQVSIKTIYYWVGRNEIPFIKVGRHLRFNIDNVIDHFRLRTRENNPYCLVPENLLKPIAVVGKTAFRSSLAIRDHQSHADPEKE